MAFATVNGARLWYDVRGPAGSPAPILLHHGYTASRVNWLPVAERLAQHHRVIMMECRGTGDSEHTAAGYTLEQYAADVIGVVDHIGVDRFTYAGHSMGGGVGYVLALDYPQRLDRLILMASVPADGFPNSDPRLHDERAALRRTRDRATLLAQYRAGCVRPDVETDAWFNSRIDHIFAVSDGHYRRRRAGDAKPERRCAIGADPATDARHCGLRRHAARGEYRRFQAAAERGTTRVFPRRTRRRHSRTGRCRGRHRRIRTQRARDRDITRNRQRNDRRQHDHRDRMTL